MRRKDIVCPRQRSITADQVKNSFAFAVATLNVPRPDAFHDASISSIFQFFKVVVAATHRTPRRCRVKGGMRHWVPDDDGGGVDGRPRASVSFPRDTAVASYPIASHTIPPSCCSADTRPKRVMTLRLLMPRHQCCRRLGTGTRGYRVATTAALA